MSDLERFEQIVDSIWELVFGTKRRKPKRARTAKGRYKADDPRTKDYNEAYVGGKAPRKLLGLKKKKARKSNAK